jgi:hypothetical protein
MNVKPHTAIRTIKYDDPKFIIHDGLCAAHRAGIIINKQCPESYKNILVECIRKGWIRPVAHMTEREMMISGLLND